MLKLIFLGKSGSSSCDVMERWPPNGNGTKMKERLYETK